MSEINELQNALKNVSDADILQGIENAKMEIESMFLALKMTIDEAKRRGLDVTIELEMEVHD